MLGLDIVPVFVLVPGVVPVLVPGVVPVLVGLPEGVPVEVDEPLVDPPVPEGDDGDGGDGLEVGGFVGGGV